MESLNFHAIILTLFACGGGFVFFHWLRRYFSAEQIVDLFILCILSIILYGYYVHLARPNPPGEVRHILEGAVSGTFQFRVLIPWMAQAISGAGIPLDLAGKILQLATLFSALAMLRWWLLHWMTREGTRLGLFFLAAVLPTTFHYWYCHEFAELALCTLGYIVMVRYPGKILAFGAVFLIAVLNKETAAFLLLPYCLISWYCGARRSAITMAAVGVLMVLGIHNLVEMVYGKPWTHPNQLALNFETLPKQLSMLFLNPGHRLNFFLVFGGFWPLLFWRSTQVPRALVFCSATFLPLLITAVPFAFMSETRIFNPVLPVFMTIILWQLSPSLRRKNIPELKFQKREGYAWIPLYGRGGWRGSQ